MAEENKQMQLLRIPEWHEEHWRQMPAFEQKDQMPFKTILVHFENRADMEKFASLVGQNIGLNTKSIWYPEATIAHWDKEWVDQEEQENEGIETLDES